MVLIIQHVASEGPGVIADYIKPNHIIRLDRGDLLPEDLNDYTALIIMGGPMNVYEEEKYPFLKQEDLLIKEALERQKPFLGVCLGAQVLAKACGFRVKKGPKKEIGWFDVRLTGSAEKDPLLSGLGEKIKVFQWHEDTFNAGPKAVLLARANQMDQALRVGKNAWGLQFHFEVTQEMIDLWSSESPDRPNGFSSQAGDKSFKYLQERILAGFNSCICPTGV